MEHDKSKRHRAPGRAGAGDSPGYLPPAGRAGSRRHARGEIGDRLKLPSPTLSFHLNQLRHTGLVTSRRQSRLIIYAAKFRTMNSLIEYLTENCCAVEASRRASATHSSAVKMPRPRIQCSLPLHQQLSPQHHGGVRDESLGRREISAFSAGSNPRGNVHPITLQVLKELKYETEGLRSKRLERVRPARQPAARFRLHPLRPRRCRDLPSMAGPADKGALGHSGPGCRRRLERGQTRSVPQSLHRAGAANQDLHGSPDRNP